MKGEHTWRYTAVATLLALLPVLIVLQVIRLQLNPEQIKIFKDQGDTHLWIAKTIVPTRGQIYDRWGHLLAANKTVYEIGVELAEARNPDTIALTLSVVLGMDYDEIFAAANQPASSNAVYAVIADHVSQEKVDRLKALVDQMDKTYAESQEKNPPSLQGLKFVPHLQRTYPENDLASNVLGFVNREGVGFFGVEEKFNTILAGKKKAVLIPRDPNRMVDIPEVPDGASLVLTLDREIQVAMEDVIDRAIATSGAESGTLVVMDPKSGDVLAMATTPRLDLNQYWYYSDVYRDETPFNRAVSQAYEPGSVYKVLTMAAGLDSNAVKPDTVFLDTGLFEIGGAMIYNWNGGAWGPQDMQGCLQHSLNVCMAWIASEVGPKTFYAYMEEFGIGNPTGINLASEVTGRLKVPGDADWSDADLGTNSFGQGVSATPLQMTAAVAALANDGQMMAPRIVRAIVHKGYQQELEPRVAGSPVSKETARTLTEMLARSLETESSDALVYGYRMAGKTGTAEIPTPLGYTSAQTNASFVGWGPADDPRFVIYIWLEKPASSIWGSEVAAPVFREAVEELVVLLDLPPDDVRRELLASNP